MDRTLRRSVPGREATPRALALFKLRANIRIPRDRLRAEDLAALLGTVRVHISRSLTSLEGAGAIEFDRHFVRVRDLEFLKQFFDGK